MTSLRLVVVLVTYVALLLTVQAVNLRNAGDVLPIRSVSGSSSDSSDDVTQSPTTLSPQPEANQVIETQSSVADTQTDGVKAWAQCGGLYFLGETKCQSHTFCKQLSDFISVCFPETRPTEKVMRLEL